MTDHYINYKTLLQKKFSAYDWAITDPTDYDTFIWNGPAELKPTKEFLDAKLAGARASYAVHRAKEYPSIEEQLDVLYHQGYDGWKASIDIVKNKYPKGNQ